MQTGRGAHTHIHIYIAIWIFILVYGIEKLLKFQLQTTHFNKILK